MKTRAFLLTVLTVSVFFGNLHVDWDSWLWGLAMGLLIQDLAQRFVRRQQREQKRRTSARR